MTTSEDTHRTISEELAWYISSRSEAEGMHEEEAFFFEVYEALEERGFCSDGQYGAYRNIPKGIRADGFAWNELDKTLCLFIIEFKNEPESPESINQGDLNRHVDRGIRFINAIIDGKVMPELPPGHESYDTGMGVKTHFPDCDKIRIIYLTDGYLSERVKKFNQGQLHGRDISVEPWDLPRIWELFQDPDKAEPIEVGRETLGEDGILALPASGQDDTVQSYLCVVPATVLRDLYNSYGQRLLEANVRSFLNFKGEVNKGIRSTLLREPERFFNYNNGITATADKIETSTATGVQKIVGLKNLQIVNGGQTTAAIYFSNKDQGGIDTPYGKLLYKDIDLSKAFVQMKLSVLQGLDQAEKDELRSDISKYANSQNGVQSADFVSNHPLQKVLEHSSRVTSFRGENGLEKWFFERVKGQYETTKRALRSQGEIRKFDLEFPKTKKLVKTDLAKFDYTWQMKPYLVKKGGQTVFKTYSDEQAKAYDKSPSSFGAEYFKDMVAKAIFFKTIDKAIAISDWYKNERGLKAEMVTYAIALFRHHLLLSGQDIDLQGIAQRQQLNVEIAQRIVEAAQIIRNHLQDKRFTDGMANISEFCKREAAWEKIKTISVDISNLPRHAVLDAEEIKNEERERDRLNKMDVGINLEADIFKKGKPYYQALLEFNTKHETHPITFGLPRAAIKFIDGGRPLTSKQIKALAKIEKAARDKGFEYSSS